MGKEANLVPEWEEEVKLSPRVLALKKNQTEFEKKKASGEFEVELKEPQDSKIIKWIILGLVAAGLILLIFLFNLI